MWRGPARLLDREGTDDRAAAAEYRESARLWGELEDESREAWVLYQLGGIYDDDPARRREAAETFARAVDLFGRAGDERQQAIMLRHLGEAWSQLGDFERAGRSHERALTFWEKKGEKDEQAACLNDLAIVRRYQGRTHAAVDLMIDEERPYCRALAIDPILRIVQGWKVEIALHTSAPKERGPEESGKITVAVVDFDNRSTETRKNLGGQAQDITTSSLYTLPGITLVTRNRLNEVRKEIKLPDSLATGTGVSRVGKLLQADAIVTGSILRYDVERRIFEGFGTNALMDVFRMEIGLQILDVATGIVRFSETYPIERIRQYPKETSAPPNPIDLTSELLTALINEAQKDLRSALMQVAGGLGTANQLIAVPVNSRPAGADVILGGIYVCKTPCDIKVARM